MKTVTKRPSDWTKENIANFWDWQSKNVSRAKQYFTYSMSPGITRLLKKKDLLKGRVLDYGCGTGYLLKQMAKENGVEFYGLDFSADSLASTKVKMANDINLKDLVLATTLPTPFPNQHFDTITVIETLEHLQEEPLHQTMDELHRILKTNGKVFITTPFNENLESHFEYCPFCHSEFHRMQHMQSFDIESLMNLASQHGFAVDYCQNINIEKYKLGPVKFYIKQALKSIISYLGIIERKIEKRPNLVAIFKKIQ